MPSICVVTSRYPPGVGGVAVSSARLVSYLIDAGFLVHVVATYPEATPVPRVEQSDERGAVVHRVYFTPERGDAQFFLRQFVRALDDEAGFDLFHAFFLTSAPACVHAAAARGDRPARPVIASARGSDAAWLLHHPLLRQIIVAALRRVAWLTALSQSTLDDLTTLAGPGVRGSVVPPGAPPVGADPWRLTDANRGVVGTTGDFRPVKDIPLLLRAYAAVPAPLRRALILAGAFSHDQEEGWSRTLIDELGVAAEVDITGRFAHSDVGAVLRRMNVYALSSASEGVSNGLLEAAAAGVPIVATAVGGVAGIVRDGETGLLVPHGEPLALADAIAGVLGDPALAARLSEGGRRLAAEFSQERERDVWVNLHRSLLT